MPKFNGLITFDVITFDVIIKEQSSEENVDKLAKTILKAIKDIEGVDSVVEACHDIEKDNDE